MVEYNKFITGFEQYTKSFLEAIENCWPLAIALLPSVNTPFINTAERILLHGLLRRYFIQEYVTSLVTIFTGLGSVQGS